MSVSLISTSEMEMQVICEIRAELGHVQIEIQTAKRNQVNVRHKTSSLGNSNESFFSQGCSTDGNSGWRVVWKNFSWQREEADLVLGDCELRYIE